MSTLTVSNISDSTTTVGTSYVVNGSAKAWINFDGTGTIAIRDSLNVASLTDNDTGVYTINLSSAFSAADYAFTSAKGRTGANGGTIQAHTNVAGGAPSASSLRVINTIENWTTSDEQYLNVSFHGDLA